MAGKRLALIIAISEYTDATLSHQMSSQKVNQPKTRATKAYRVNCKTIIEMKNEDSSLSRMADLQKPGLATQVGQKCSRMVASFEKGRVTICNEC